MSARETPSIAWDAPLVMAALVIAIASMVGVWWGVAPRSPDDLQRYYPLHSGVSLAYRVTHPDGAVSYQTSNIEQLPGSDAVQLLDTSSFGSLMKLLGIDVVNFDVDKAQAAVTGERFARVVDTDFTSAGVFTPTTSILLVRPSNIGLLKQENLGLDPPLPVLADLSKLNAPYVVTGIINNALPYTATLVLEAREAISTPLGALPDCIRLRSQLDAPNYESVSRGWYCAGIGLARQEFQDITMPANKLYELIAVSSPAKVAQSNVPAALKAGQSAVLRDLPQAGSLTPGLAWSFAEQRSNSGIMSPVVVADGLLIYATQNGAVVAVDRAQRQLRWRFQTGSTSYGAPVVADGLVYLTSSDRKVYAVDLASGAFRWAFAAKDAMSGGPAVADGVVYVGSDDRSVYALDANTGQQIWRYQTGGPVAATPVVAAGMVYVGSDDGALYALDAKTGEPLWAFAAGGAVTAPVAVAGGVVYAASHDQNLYALKAQTNSRAGELIWSFHTEEEITIEPVASGGVVYLTISRQVWALDATSGTERWLHTSNRGLRGAPLRVGPNLLIRREHDVLVLDAQTGAERGAVPTAEAPAYAGLSTDGQNIFVGHFDGLLQVFALTPTRSGQ